MICNTLIDRVLERGAPSARALVGAALHKLSWSATRSGAPKKAEVRVGAQLAREFSTDRKTKYFFSIASVPRKKYG